MVYIFEIVWKIANFLASFAIFSFWNMIYFVFKIPIELGTWMNSETLTSDIR